MAEDDDKGAAGGAGDDDKGGAGDGAAGGDDKGAGDGELERVRAALAKANKEAETSRKKLKEHEDAGKSELEKATSRAAELERELADTTSRALKLEVAAEKGLTSKQASRLVGATREELEADADELLASFGGKDDSKTPPGSRPKARLKPGSGNDTDPPDETDPRKLAAMVPRR